VAKRKHVESVESIVHMFIRSEYQE